MKLVIAAAAAATLVLALAGCSSPASSPRPTATPLSAAQKCTPSTAKVQWPPAEGSDNGVKSGKFVPVLVQVFDDSKPGALGPEKDFNVAPKTTVVYPSDPTYNWSSAPKKAWLASLVESARLSGQVFPGYDVSTKVPTIKSAGDFHSGVHVVVTEIELVTVPFEIICAGQRTIPGIISGPNNRVIVPEVITCGSTTAHKGDQAIRTRALALAPKYCPPAKS